MKRTGGGSVRAVPALLAGWSLAILLAACGSPTPALSPLAPDAVILAFGDSLTAGTGAGADESYPAVLERLTGRKVVNAGVPGETSTGGLRRLPRELERHRPDLMVLCHGGNDFLRKLDGEGAEQNLIRMVRMARDRGVAVVMVGVPKPGVFLSTADLYERVAGAEGVPLESEVLPDILGDNRLKSDTVHPNAAGYEQLATAVRDLLRESGAL